MTLPVLASALAAEASGGGASRGLRTNGAFYCRSELSAAWGLTLPPMPGYLWFHVVASGRAWLETDARRGVPEARP